jgi:Tol biopolymer transport system component/predicted Ser/Thr protein kinase
MIGTRLGHYEITARLGAGGMGEVYQAVDVKLGRSVAIKVLPAAFVSDAERLSRFRREAQVLASLNHSNIAQIYGLEDSGGAQCIVMELVDGETLQSVIRKGLIPVDDALAIAKQIVEALEAAHDKGIVHRDLKPGNVMLTANGNAKVLDFGLAKPSESNASDATLSNSPTMGSLATGVFGTSQGVILGTAAYMSPEQARGKLVDKRSDIWAFGAVLYEMLTGRRAFPGDDLTDTLASVVKLDPDWNALGTDVPLRVTQVLRMCLRKDPRQRLQSMGDVRLALEGAFDTPLPQAAASGSASKLRWPLAVAVGGLAGALLSAAALWTWIASHKPAAPPVAQVSVMAPANRPISVGGYPTRSLAISPDASHVVYVATNLDAPSNRPGGRTQLELRSMETLEVLDLPGTTGARQPFFSPDGQWVAFFTASELKKVSLAGGNPVTLVPGINGAGSAFGVWNTDDTIIFGTLATGLRRVSSEGGEVTDLTRPEKAQDEIYHINPALVPSGLAVLFSIRYRDPTKNRIDAVMLDSGKRQVVLENARTPLVLSSGHLLFQRDEGVLIAPFDVDRLAVTGPAIPIRNDVRRDDLSSPYALAELAVSTNGTLVYLPAVDTSTVLGLVSRQGMFEPLGPSPDNLRQPHLSPDGNSVAYIVAHGSDSTVRIYDRIRGSTTSLTRQGTDDGLAWRDNRSLAVASRAKSAIFLHSLDGGDPRLLVSLPEGATALRNMSWSSDGTRLAYTVQTGLLHDIWVLTMGDKPTAAPLLQSPTSEYGPKFSPDGNWLAYSSNESGRYEIYVRRYPDGPTYTVSTSGGNGPVWKPDGRELYFQTEIGGVAKMMTVPVTYGGTSLRLGVPQPLFDLRITSPTGEVERYAGSVNFGPNYDVLPDGRFLMHRGPDASGARELILVQNWFEELKRLAAVK